MAYTSPFDPKSSEARSSWLAGLTEAMSIVTRQLDLKADEEPVEVKLTELFIDDSDRYRIYQADKWNKLWLTTPPPVIKKNGEIITEDTDHFTIDHLGGSIAFDDIYRLTGDDTLTATVCHILGNEGTDRSEVLESIKNQMATLSAEVKEKAVKTEVNEQIQQLTQSIDTKTATLTQGLQTANEAIEQAQTDITTNKAEAEKALQTAQEELETALESKADLVDGKVNPEQLPEMNYDPKGSAAQVKTELQAEIDKKQNKLEFDKTPTAGSAKPVESQGIKSYVDGEVTKAKDEATKAVNDAKSGEFDVTLTVEGWAGGTTQTVSNPKLTMNGVNYIISSDPDNWSAYNVAGVHGMDMTEEGKMTFQCTEGETPEQELVVHLMAVATKEE